MKKPRLWLVAIPWQAVVTVRVKASSEQEAVDLASDAADRYVGDYYYPRIALGEWDDRRTIIALETDE